METDHRIAVGDARDMAAVADDSVELVVTSPPYPMIELWDELFAELNPDVGDALEAGEGRTAFEAMHRELDRVWEEVGRVLVDGGVACVNVGDATRRLDGSFRVYPNHSRIVEAFEDLGFDPLPEVLWRKPVNSGTKFMGSGMVPPNAYVTLEHEYVLVFRNGGSRRSFEPGAERRYESAYFWEERNRWFSDVWTDVVGELQAMDHGDGRGRDDGDLRDRSAAYPFEIPYRLINMYSVYGDTVLDPFWGTGTTSLAAMAAARNSVGYELREEFLAAFEERVAGLGGFVREVVRSRLADHEAFVEERLADGKGFEHEAKHYDVPVVTGQERSIRFYGAEEVVQTDAGYAVTHCPVDGADLRSGPDAHSRGAATSSDG